MPVYPSSSTLTPNMQVLVYFDFLNSTTVPAGNWFTLDDATKGKLDSATYKLYASTPVDVTADVTYMSIRRGVNSQLFPSFNAGTAVITLNNDRSASAYLGVTARKYDPTYTSSPFFGNIVPNKRVVVNVNGTTIFDGRIADWDFNYEVSGRSVATMKCADGLAILARQALDTYDGTTTGVFSGTVNAKPTAGDDTGTRINWVINKPEVQWASATAIDTGKSTCTSDAISFGTNVLSYLNQVAETELGYLFVSRTGTLTFKNRHVGFLQSSKMTFSDVSSTSPTVVPYSSIGTLYGSELLYNRIVVNSTGLGQATYLNVSSQSTYGLSAYQSPTLLLQDSGQTSGMAVYLGRLYGTPEYRVQSVSTQLVPLTANQQSGLASLDITDRVSVTFTPNGVGSAMAREALIIGIDWEGSPASLTATYSLSEIDVYTAQFLLDSTTLGVLDTSTLAF